MASLDLFAGMTGLLQALEQRGIEYAVCGGLALAIHRVPRTTQGIDAMGPQDLADVQRLSEVHRG